MQYKPYIVEQSCMRASIVCMCKKTAETHDQLLLTLKELLNFTMSYENNYYATIVKLLIKSMHVWSASRCNTYIFFKSSFL